MSDLIEIPKNAIYSVAKYFKCPDCESGVEAEYHSDSLAICVSCEKCAYTSTTAHCESLRSFISSRIGEDYFNFIIGPKEPDEVEPATEYNPVPENKLNLKNGASKLGVL